jgi:O-succinylbenzoate synthase
MNPSMYVHRYVLRSAAPLNAASLRQEFHGALIRVDDECGGGGCGYGCVHPWPELGDAPLEDQLAMLAVGETTPVLSAALACAQADGVARWDGKSLFDGVEVPQSHATLPMDETLFDRAVQSGFDCVKVKMGRDLSKESEFVRQMADRYPALRWRMDFNGTCSREKVDSFQRELDEGIMKKIDFFEDAYQPSVDPVGPMHFISPVAQAVDREVVSWLERFDVAVLKPAVNEMQPLLQRASFAGKRVVVTSYMDHPLGQSYAAWQAALAKRDDPNLIDVCGLVTHGLFEPDAFTESLGTPSATFHPAAGTGLGFDALLEALPWKRLC